MMCVGAKILRTGLKARVVSGNWSPVLRAQAPVQKRAVVGRAGDAFSGYDDPPQMDGIDLNDIVPGETYPGIVKTVKPYGAFVDIGTSTDGLVHISQVSNDYVTDIYDYLSPGQNVQVRVISVEGDKRLSLSMKDEY